MHCHGFISRRAVPRMQHCHVLAQRHETVLNAFLQISDGARVGKRLPLQATGNEYTPDCFHHCLHVQSG